MDTERAIRIGEARGLRWFAEALLLGAIMAGIVTEFVSLDVQRFWQTHPILGALTSSGLVLALTVLVIDQTLDRRNARRWRRVAQTAYRELSTVAFDAMVALGRAARVKSHDPEDIARGVSAALADERLAVDFLLALREENERLGSAVARWAPVMLERPDLAEALDDFTRIRDELHRVPRAFFSRADDLSWQDDARAGFQGFLGELALFHLRRKIALGELTAEDVTGLSDDAPELRM